MITGERMRCVSSCRKVQRPYAHRAIIPAKAGIHVALPYAASLQVWRPVVLRTPNGFPCHDGTRKRPGGLPGGLGPGPGLPRQGMHCHEPSWVRLGTAMKNVKWIKPNGSTMRTLPARYYGAIWNPA